MAETGPTHPEQNVQKPKRNTFAFLGKCVGAAVFGGMWFRVVSRVPINGWGSVAWLAGMTALQVIRAPFQKQVKTETVVHNRMQRTERVLLGMQGPGCFYAPCLHLMTGVFSFANNTQPSWMTMIGAAGTAFSLWLFRASHVDLGKYWSVTTQIIDKHSLVTTGVYKYVRHPMYTSLWLLWGFCPLLIQNFLVGWMPVVVFGMLYFVRVPYEEKMMIEEFGDEYRDYCARTGRLWPPLWSRKKNTITQSISDESKAE